MKTGVFIGCPTFDGKIDHGCAIELLSHASRERITSVAISQSLAIAPASNTLWADALNARDSDRSTDDPGIGWFAMLHSDINPGPWWVDRLIAEAECHDADMVSAVVPFKTGHGLTSTAMSDPGNSLRNWCRLTLRQVNHESFPKTFDSEMAREALANLPDELAVECPEDSMLLVNTGCMVCRVDRPWAGDVWFEQLDRIIHRSGRWMLVALSEDWFFSKNVSEHGGKVMATTALKVLHRGSFEYPSDIKEFGWAKDFESIGGCDEATARKIRELSETGVSP